MTIDAHQRVADRSIDETLQATEPRRANDVLLDLHERSADGRAATTQPIGLGFEPLDGVLGGGIRPGDLLLLGGAPGAGKTTFALQAARHIAAAGQATCVYLCYEHDEDYLLTRLISLESTGPRPGLGQERVGLTYTETRNLLVDCAREQRGLWQAFAAQPAVIAGLERIERYGPRLLLQKGSGVRTDVPAIVDQMVELRGRIAGALVLVVDFLQKVPSYPETEDEAQRVTRVVQALKDLALSRGIAVIAIVASEKDALDGRRLRPHHFRGSSALVYEADVILVFNSKYQIVAKSAIQYNLYRAQELHDWVVCSVEKNRSGRDLLDLQFRKRFAYACFDPQGSVVEERLIGDRVST